MADKKLYVIQTQKGYMVTKCTYSEQLRHAKIYTSLHYADEAVKTIKRIYPKLDDPQILEVNLCLADKNTAADVVEVRHGTWILNKDGSGTCDRCGMTQKGVWDYDNWQNYCGCCGARMDGEREEQT